MQHFGKNWVKSTFVMLFLSAITWAANAQNTQSANLYQALQNQQIATEIEAENFSADWHIISVTPATLFAALIGSSRDSAYQTYFYTQGEILEFGTQNYLVTYRTRDGQDVERRSENSDAPNQGFLVKDAVLALALLPISEAQAIYEIKQFNPQTDLLSRDAIAAEKSVSNLKQIALAVFMYTQDYDEKLPPMVAARDITEIREVGSNVTPQTTVQSRLQPYTKSWELFLQPATRRPYLPNYKISRQAADEITNPTATILFYEDAPSSDGKRAVAYADGHVARIEEAAFQRQRQAQGISESGFPSAMKPARRP